MSVSLAKDVIQQVLSMIRSGLVGPHTHSARSGGPIVTDLPITSTNALAPALNCRTQILNQNFNADLWRGQRYYSQSTQPQPSKVPVNKGDSWFDGLHQWQWTGSQWVEQANISDISASQRHPLLDGNIDSDTVASSPVRGGLIVGNSASKWAQYVLGSSGYYLRSNGTDLLYSALLMGDASGVLAVANGGTATSTAFTAGSVVFAGASGVYSQDNANLFWDATNHRLGIGTASPASLLDVEAGTVTSTSPPAVFTLAETLGNSGAIGGIVSMFAPSFYDSSTANRVSGQILRFTYIRNPGATGIPTIFDAMFVLSAVINENMNATLHGLEIEGPVVAAGKTLTTWRGIYVGVPSGSGTVTAPYAITTEPNAGNVGIGVTTPSFKLHVVGDANIGSSWPVGQLLIQGATNANYKLAIGYDTTNNQAVIQPGEAGVVYRNLALNPNGGNVLIGKALEIFQTAALTAGSVGSLVIPVNEGSTVSVLTDALAGNLDGAIGGLYDSTGTLYKIGIRLNGLWKHVAVAGFHIPNASKQVGTDGTVGVDETKCPLCKKQMKPGDKLCMVADKWDNGKDSKDGLHAVACHLTCPK